MPNLECNNFETLILAIKYTMEMSKNIPEEVLVVLPKLDDSQQVKAQLCDMLRRVDHTLLNNVDKKYLAVAVLEANVTTISVMLLGHEHHAQPG